jgi:hypothetical protein
LNKKVSFVRVTVEEQVLPGNAFPGINGITRFTVLEICGGT